MKEPLSAEMISFLRVTIQTISEQLQGKYCSTFVKAVIKVAKGNNANLAEPLLPIFEKQFLDPETLPEQRKLAFEHMNYLLVALAPSVGNQP